MAETQSFQNILLQGTVHAIGPVESRGSKGFQVHAVIIETNAEYEGDKYLSIDFKGKMANLPTEAGIGVGDVISVRADLGGRLYNGKAYNALSGFKIRIDQKAFRQQINKATEPQIDMNGPDDLPF